MMTGRIINNLPRFRVRTDEGIVDSVKTGFKKFQARNEYIPDRWSMAWGTFAKDLAKEVIANRDKGVTGFIADHKDVLEGKNTQVNEEVVTEAKGQISDETYDKLIGYAKDALNSCLSRYGEYKDDAEEIEALVRKLGKRNLEANTKLQKAVSGFNDLRSVIDKSYSQTKKESLTAEEKEATGKVPDEKEEKAPKTDATPDAKAGEEEKEKSEEKDAHPETTDSGDGVDHTDSAPENADKPTEDETTGIEVSDSGDEKPENADGEDGREESDAGAQTIPPPPGPDGKPQQEQGTVVPGNDNIKPPESTKEEKNRGYSDVWDMIADFRRKFDKKGLITFRIIHQMFAALKPVEKKMKQEGRDFAKDGAKEVARAALSASGGDVAAGAVR